MQSTQIRTCPWVHVQMDQAGWMTESAGEVDHFQPTWAAGALAPPSSPPASPRCLWAAAGARMDPVPIWRVKPRDSATGDITPSAPLSFLASAHQKLSLWKTNRALCQEGLPDLLVVSAVCRALSQAAWPQGAHGEPGSGDGLPGVQTLQSHLQVASPLLHLSPSGQQPAWGSFLRL